MGFKQAMQQRWVAISKGSGAPLAVRKVDAVEDSVRATLERIAAHDDASVPSAAVAALKKRKLVTPETWKTYRLTKGPKFARERVKEATDLTADMLAKCACVSRVFLVWEWGQR